MGGETSEAVVVRHTVEADGADVTVMTSMGELVIEFSHFSLKGSNGARATKVFAAIDHAGDDHPDCEGEENCPIVEEGIEYEVVFEPPVEDRDRQASVALVMARSLIQLEAIRAVPGTTSQPILTD